jgi:hypothetical protein
MELIGSSPFHLPSSQYDSQQHRRRRTGDQKTIVVARPLAAGSDEHQDRQELHHRHRQMGQKAHGLAACPTPGRGVHAVNTLGSRRVGRQSPGCDVFVATDANAKHATI